MLRFRFCLPLLLSFALGLASLPAMAAPADDAGAYIKMLGDRTLATISNAALSKDQKQEQLDAMFSRNVDIPWVGRFVMGRFWKQASDDQKARYLKAYETFVIRHYTARFTDYTSGSFKVVGTRDDGGNEFTVNMQIQAQDGSQNQPVNVDYRVRRGEDGAFKIFDVIVEGVSLLATQRSEFASVITNNGIDYLIQQLATRSMPDTAQ